MTRTMSRPAYGTADPKLLASTYGLVQKARALQKEDPEFVRRHDICTTLRATASSQNIEGGHSTPLDVARAVRRAGDALKS